MAQIPNSLRGAQDPKSNTLTGDITPSNKSSQTPQAAAQNLPQGRGSGDGAGYVAGAGSRQRQIVNGKNGKASFRK